MASDTEVLVISGSSRAQSRTRTLAHETERIANDYSVATEVLDLGENEMEFFDGRVLEDYNTDTQRAIRAVLDADILVWCSPVYFSGISGGMKNLIDLIPYEEFASSSRSAGMIMAGRDNRHQALLDVQLRTILVYLGVRVANTGVFATEEDFHEFSLTNDSLRAWIDQMLSEAIDLWKLSN